MFPKDLRAGALIDGKRVVRMAPARVNGCDGVLVTVKGGQGVFYPHGVRVPGTRKRTDMPAGPVRSGGGTTSYTRPGRRDGESAGDRHSRLIDSIAYA